MIVIESLGGWTPHFSAHGDMTYQCSACEETLGAEAFSKKQINKWEHGHSPTLTCVGCVHKKVLAEELMVEKTKKAKEKADDVVEKGKDACVEGSKSDPSLRYIDDPLKAPIITDAQQHFEQKYRKTILISLKEKWAWRSHVKIAVRGTTITVRKRKVSRAELSIHDQDAEPTSKKEKIVKTKIGLFKPGTHEVVECLESPAHHPSINLALQAIHRAVKAVGIHGYIEGHEYDAEECARTNTYLKYLVMSVERGTGAVQLTIVLNAPSDDQHAQALLAKLVRCIAHNALGVAFHSIWANHHVTSKHDNTITGRDPDNWVLRHGERFLVEDCHLYPQGSPYAPMRLHFLPFVFRQANIDAFGGIIERISHSLTEWRERHDKAASRCLELYGGIGTIGLHLLQHFSVLHCSDENPFNQVCFEKSRDLLAQGLEGQGVLYFPYSAEKMVQREEVVFNLQHGERSNEAFYDVIVVDPPRKGLDASVLHALVASRPRAQALAAHGLGKKKRFDVFGEEDPSADVPAPQRLVYVSCGFEALKRDLAVLTNSATVESDLEAQGLQAPVGRKRERPDSSAGLLPSATKESAGFWRIQSVFGFVLFPGADHLETLVVLDREV